MNRSIGRAIIWVAVLMISIGTAHRVFCAEAVENCITCHTDISPGQVADWKTSKHAAEGITCSVCHGDMHTGADDITKAIMPDEQVCAECHETRFNQFLKGKHNLGWSSMNALPVTHVEPDELMEGGRGCGGCHNMGVKTEEQKKELHGKGYRYQNNSCDECHTRHSFSRKEAQNPEACRQCHMGFDHPQWEMWNSSKHGTRWQVKISGMLDENANAPRCQDCHMSDGNHENHTAWGFLGVRLPLPEDPVWAADRVTILKALGVLHPETGEPTSRYEAVKTLDMVRLTAEDWNLQREKMIKTCSSCHSEKYARQQLEMGDSMMKKADRLMAEAIDIVAQLYRDGILKKPDAYEHAYPDLLYFMRTGGGNLDQASHIDQMLLEMYLKDRMRTFQAFFHVNPDYAYWYGWAMMTEKLAAIKETAEVLRKVHEPEKK